MKLSELNNEPRMVRRIRELCEGVPKGEVITTSQVALALGVTNIRNWSADPRLKPFRVDIKRQTWWGSRETIKNA